MISTRARSLIQYYVWLFAIVELSRCNRNCTALAPPLRTWLFTAPLADSALEGQKLLLQSFQSHRYDVFSQVQMWKLILILLRYFKDRNIVIMKSWLWCSFRYVWYFFSSIKWHIWEVILANHWDIKYIHFWKLSCKKLEN